MGKISVHGLGKAYRKYPSRWGRLKEWVFPWGRAQHALKWVLQDLNFEVQPGQALGIIGINGAGKSTLLKMIAQTSHPTTGTITTTGRVAALLELGMGFHPEFTGRENSIMAGQLLGLSAEEVQALMPSIEEFAEIGDYIDAPVRVYSSGMQVRLAFSLATAVRPDILIVDEALSVGDVYFQHKSFSRIRDFRKQGTTLLIVSHDKAAIQAVCDSAILIDGGRIRMEGAPESVMDFYNALIADREAVAVQQTRCDTGAVQTKSGTGEASLSGIYMLNDAGERISVVRVGQRVRLVLEIFCRETIPQLVVGFMIKDRLGLPVFGTNTYYLGKILFDLPAGARPRVEFVFSANVGVGNYSIAIALHENHEHIGKNYEWRDLAFMFDVTNVDKVGFVGGAWLSVEAHVAAEAGVL